MQVTNNTPRAVSQISIRILYPDTQGRMREARPRLNGTIAAGKSQIVDLPIRVNPQLAKRIQVGVVQANLQN